MIHKHQFISNDTKISFIDKLLTSVSTCDSFFFTVSFIKYAGLQLVEDAIYNALKRGVQGRMITSTYQNFTDIQSLNTFLKWQNEFPNFLVHLDHNSFDNRGFHSKGYIFEYKEHFEILIGSSNITRYALQKNVEWNMLVSSDKTDQIVEDIMEEYNYLFQNTNTLTKELIHKYDLIQEYVLDKWDMDLYFSSDSKIVPNYMQKRALKEIERYRNNNVKRALVIAATGSGKTYLAAFDAKSFQAKKLLFVVHRDTILHSSLQVFKSIIGNDFSYGLLVGDRKEIDKDYIFASNMMLVNNLDKFSKDHFDYIIIDEVHHSVADTYQKIIQYFKPNFMLGLTATPERMDSKDVFELFEHNVPYELRLRDALMNDLIVPFHYYGIRDSFVDYSLTDVKELVKQLSSSIRAEFIDKKIKEIGYSGTKLKAIGFCKNVDHAIKTSEQMNDLGYHTIYLTGQSSLQERRLAFVDLQDDDHPLEIVFTVDILNEGVDIPAINTVLFLRPTESSTIFIQQLGRGLRKYENKEYLTVLDFIGNNYLRGEQIALALGTLSNNLYSDKKYLKDSIRNDFKNLNLPVKIEIDALSKEEILKRIEQTNFNSKKFIEQDYKNFKKICDNKIPTHQDFLKYESAPDLLKIIKLYKSYYQFLQSIEHEFNKFDQEQVDIIQIISNMIPIIRPYEFKILSILIEYGEQTKKDLYEIVKDSTPNFNEKSFYHTIDYLQLKFSSQKQQEKGVKLISNSNDMIRLNIDYKDHECKEHLLDLLKYGILRYELEFNYHEEPLKLYGHYDRRQFLLATNYTNIHDFPKGIWQIGKIVSIFVNLHKEDHIQDTLKYEDEFLTKSILKWESSTSTTLTNNNGKKLLSCTEVHIFVRKFIKEDGITQPYVYVGKGSFTNPRTSKNIAKTILIDVILENELPEELAFEFLD